MNLGIIARADKTGLGNQTRNLVRMLGPFRVMVIDSTPFNRNQQFFGTYQRYNTLQARGFPTDFEVQMFLRGLDAVLTCELFYNKKFVRMANRRGVRTYNQYNYEFCDHLSNPKLELPTKLLSPSYWHLEDMQQRYPGRVEYLPPPTFEGDFSNARAANHSLGSKPRFLHVVGRMASNDRNGTFDLLEALKHTKTEFELVLKIQSSKGKEIPTDDPRVVLDRSAPQNEAELYSGFHAMILPRRYAGLCLPMNEALMAAMPVIMTDIEPNNRVLPGAWLVDAEQSGTFQARTETPLYSAKPKALAKRIDEFCQQIASGGFLAQQDLAFTIARDNYSAEALLPRYKEIVR